MPDTAQKRFQTLVRSISAAQLAERLETGAAPFVLDVREPEELAAGTIAGAVNVPMDEVAGRLHELPADRDIVVVCHLGGRSAFITAMLNGKGFDRAVNLTGGMDAWMERRR